MNNKKDFKIPAIEIIALQNDVVITDSCNTDYHCVPDHTPIPPGPY